MISLVIDACFSYNYSLEVPIESIMMIGQQPSSNNQYDPSFISDPSFAKSITITDLSKNSRRLFPLTSNYRRQANQQLHKIKIGGERTLCLGQQ